MEADVYAIREPENSQRVGEVLQEVLACGSGSNCESEIEGIAMSAMKTTALAPWFGSSRMIAKDIGKLLDGCEWVGIPFAGGMSEVPHITARGLLVNDLHRDIINLARVTVDRELRRQLMCEAEKQIFHPDKLSAAQDACKSCEPPPGPNSDKTDYLDGQRALDYFTAVWMGRSGQAGTDDEFNGNLAMRFTASGGGSNTRYRSAIESLEAWGHTLKRCEFSCLDWRVFLTKCQDRPKHGLYVDAPWPKDGGNYVHKFTEQDQRDLAAALAKFDQCRVVVRYGDHPLIRELYPESRWDWRMLTSRTQGNNDKAEALITNRWKA
jgi:DNA adenine methylase